MKKLGVDLYGKIDDIAKQVYLNRQGWTRLLSQKEDYTGWIRKMYQADEDHLNNKIVAIPIQTLKCLYIN